MKDSIRPLHRHGKAQVQLVFFADASVLDVFCQITDNEPAKSPFWHVFKIYRDVLRLAKGGLSVRHGLAVVLDLKVQPVGAMIPVNDDGAGGSDGCVSMFDDVVECLGKHQLDGS